MVGRTELTEVTQRLALIARAPVARLTVRRADEVAVHLVGALAALRAARTATVAPVHTTAVLRIGETRVVEALTDDGARRLTITLATRTLTRRVATHTVGAEVRRALVINLTRVTIALLRVALVGVPVAAVLTVVTRDALSVVRAERVTHRTITDVALTELVIGVHARTRAITLVVLVVVASRTALSHTRRRRVVEVTSTVTVARTVSVTRRRAVVWALAERIGGQRNCLTRAGTITHAAQAAGVVPVLVLSHEVLALTGAIATGARVASHGVRRELTSAATITGTAAKTLTMTLVLGIRSVVAQAAKTEAAALVALLAQTVTRRLAAHTVYTEVAVAVRVLLAGRALRIVQTTHRSLLVAVRPVIAIEIRFTDLLAQGLVLIERAVAPHAHEETAVLRLRASRTRRVVVHVLRRTSERGTHRVDAIALADLGNRTRRRSDVVARAVVSRLAAVA